MYRYQKHAKRRLLLLFIKILPLIIVCSLMVSGYLYMKSSIIIEAPKVVLGEKIIITLSSGVKMYTYERLIIEKNGRLYYKGERNEFELMDARIEYEDWD